MKIIAGNWKMNGSRAALGEMIDAITPVRTENRVILCVPFTMVRAGTDKVAIGAQDISAHEKGAYTGEVSGTMLAEAGAKYVIVGHSERRMYHDETNDIVRQKAQMALENGLTPIICVGETMDEKRAGKTLGISSPKSVLSCSEVKDSAFQLEPGTFVVSTSQDLRVSRWMSHWPVVLLSEALTSLETFWVRRPSIMLTS